MSMDRFTNDIKFQLKPFMDKIIIIATVVHKLPYKGHSRTGVHKQTTRRLLESNLIFTQLTTLPFSWFNHIIY